VRSPELAHQGHRCIVRKELLSDGDSVPMPLGFIAFAPEWLFSLRSGSRRSIPAAEPALRSHPCVAVSSAQVRSV
jgi:hypothetical protein